MMIAPSTWNPYRMIRSKVISFAICVGSFELFLFPRLFVRRLCSERPSRSNPTKQGIALGGPENRPMTQNRAEQLWWASGCKHCRRWCERYDTPSARLRVTVRAKLVRFHTFIRLRESPRQWHSSCANDDSCHGADLARSKRLVYTLARSGLGYGINAF